MYCSAVHTIPKTPWEGGLDLTGWLTKFYSASYENLIAERRGGRQDRRDPDLVPTIGENHPKTGNVHYLPGEALLQSGDVGLIPWGPLTDHPDPPETVMQRCREEIEKHAPAGEMANLLAVTQVLSFLRYNDVGLLTILGGRRIMLKSPMIDDLVMEKYGDVIAEKTHRTC